MKIRLFILASVLIGAVSGSMAVSLGRSSGAALLGRPLDITVQVEPGPADAGASSCVEADVFYADERIAASRVQVSLEKAASAQDARIRIRVARPVDEPVVTLYVRAGCLQRTEKRYVLLADLVTEQASASRAPDLVARPAAEARSLADTSSGVAALRRPRDPVRPPAAASGNPDRSVEQVPRVRRFAPPQATAKASPRLRLEPIDLSVETFPQLRPSTEMLSLPATNPEQRTQAAALWKALSTGPEDVLEAAVKVAAIEAAVRALQVETRRNQAALTEFSTALQTARQERYANGLVYGLLAALAIALAGLVYAWQRWRSPSAAVDKPWWRRRMPVDTGWHSELGSVASGYHSHDGHEAFLPPDSGDKPVPVNADTGARSADRRRVAPSRAMPLSRRDQTDFGLSMPHTPRAAKAEELFDVQHQAEFFVSIGKEDQAISVLLEHMGDDVQVSALIYLDLFNLYHKVKRREDYEELAESFSRMFNARIPAFDAYTSAGRGLESYTSTIAQIRSAWPRPAVVSFMESLIFLRPGEQREPFDPEAFRELLVLYGIARDIVEAQPPLVDNLLDFDLPVAGADAAPSAGLPLTAMDALPVIEDPVAVPGEPKAGLDIDLNMLGDKGRPTTEGPHLAVPVAELTDELPPIAGGNLIDFEALTPGSPPAAIIKGDAAFRH
ncbi:hypothetical protein [Polaromonas sp.]|uniref:hypothetical protein n=1 Tax=Polaromonas sp. TaxID=1869339 RepID=UPI003751C756